MIISPNETLDISVTKATCAQALLFIDTLIKALRARGHQVVVANRKTCAVVAGEEFELALREKMRREIVAKGQWKRQEFRPTGKLALQVDSRWGREYKDGTHRLEEQIAKIIAGLEQSAVQKTIRKAEADKAEAERKRKAALAERTGRTQRKQPI